MLNSHDEKKKTMSVIVQPRVVESTNWHPGVVRKTTDSHFIICNHLQSIREYLNGFMCPSVRKSSGTFFL